MPDDNDLYNLPEDSVESPPFHWIYFNKKWLPIVLGILSRLYNQNLWNWTNEGDLDLIETNIDTLLSLFGQGGANMSCNQFRNSPDNPNLIQVSCDGGETWIDGFNLLGGTSAPQTRYDENGHKQVSYDGGETWVNNDETDPRFNGDNTQEVTGSDPSCRAGERLAARGLEIRDYIINLLVTAPTLVAIVFGLATFLAALLGFGIAVPFMIAFISTAFALGAAGLEAALPEDAFDEFKCIVFCVLNQNPDGNKGRVLFQNYDQIIEAVRAHYSDIQQLFFEFYVMTLGQIGLITVAQMGNSDGDTCGDCECENWSHTWFGVDNGFPLEMEVTQGETDETNKWVYGSVAAGTYEPEFSLIDAQIRMCGDEAGIITRVIVEFQTVVTSVFTPRGSNIRTLNSGCTEDLTIASVSTTVGGTYIMDTGIIAEETRGIGVYISSRSQGASNDICRIKRVVVQGTGHDPFGDW